MPETPVSVRRAQGVELHEVDGVVEVQTSSVKVHLSTVAAATFSAIPPEGESDLASITESLVDQFGAPDPPASAEALARRHVYDLAAHGIVTVVEDAGSPSGPSSPADGAAAVRAALRHVLQGAGGTWTLDTSLDPDAFTAAARRHHVVPLLARGLPSLDLPDAVAADLKAEAARRVSAAQALADVLVTTATTLEDAGIRYLNAKGLTLAHQAYGDFTARGAGDIDLLVSPDDLETAFAALESSGCRVGSTYPTPGPSWAWRHFRRTGHELTLHHGASAIDLHWHLTPIHSDFPGFDELWHRRDVVEIGDHPVTCLGTFDALAHSAAHAATDEWRWLRGLADIHALASHTGTWKNPDRPLSPIQLTSLGLAARLFGVPPGAPPVVHEAQRDVPERLWSHMLDLQATTSSSHQGSGVVGLDLLRSVRILLRATQDPKEAWRLTSRVLFLPSITVRESSPHALVAVPRALRLRLREVRGRLKRR